VDRDCRRNTRPASLFFAVIPVLLGVSSLRQGGALGNAFGGTLCAIAAAWASFVTWRALIALKVYGRASGRVYERRTRYKLPPEYVDSEDALLSAERRRRTKE
jgi:hypothetical protein